MSLFAIEFEAARRRANEAQPPKQDPERPSGPTCVVQGCEAEAAEAFDALERLLRITRDPDLEKFAYKSLIKAGVLVVDRK